MKCKINGKVVEARVVENLGFQGGKYVKEVMYDGKKYIVVKECGLWIQHSPTVRFGCGYRGQLEKVAKHERD